MAWLRFEPVTSGIQVISVTTCADMVSTIIMNTFTQ
jgi:hypothetical protein